MNLSELLINSKRGWRREVVQAETQSFSNESLNAITRPCVYIFVKDGRALYVGSSVNGIIRFGDPSHNNAKVRAIADEVQVLWFDNVANARRIESYLIRELKSPLNRENRPRIRAGRFDIDKFVTAQKIHAHA